MVANFSINVSQHVMEEISLLVTVARTNREYTAALAGRPDPQAAKEVVCIQQATEGIEYIEAQVISLLTLMKSPHVKDANDRLAYWAKSKTKDWGELFTRACVLRDALRIEFKEYLFYVYPKEKGDFLNSWEANWGKISVAFPEVRTESYSSVDCYALGHSTASVFHSMRVAECGLRALAKERRITLPKNKAIEWATWQEIIKALDIEIKRIGETEKAGNAKDAALAFYSGARADLNGFKDEFRNLVMHVRGQYDEFQARRALTQVHDFMARLAEKVDHRHHRIRWGRSS